MPRVLQMVREMLGLGHSGHEHPLITQPLCGRKGCRRSSLGDFRDAVLTGHWVGRWSQGLPDLRTQLRLGTGNPAPGTIRGAQRDMELFILSRKQLEVGQSMK